MDIINNSDTTTKSNQSLVSVFLYKNKNPSGLEIIGKKYYEKCNMSFVAIHQKFVFVCLDAHSVIQVPKSSFCSPENTTPTWKESTFWDLYVPIFKTF